jgi:hypothetical protein
MPKPLKTWTITDTTTGDVFVGDAIEARDWLTALYADAPDDVRERADRLADSIDSSDHPDLYALAQFLALDVR